MRAALQNNLSTAINGLSIFKSIVLPALIGFLVTHRDDDALVEQTVLLGRHDKVMRVVLVVDDVLQVNASRLSQQNNVLLPFLYCTTPRHAIKQL